LYEEMERSDENSSLRNWILARNFLKRLFWPLFLGVYRCIQSQSIKCRVLVQGLFAKTKVFMADCSFLRT
jgi:hypothetical protein